MQLVFQGSNSQCPIIGEDKVLVPNNQQPVILSNGSTSYWGIYAYLPSKS